MWTDFLTLSAVCAACVIDHRAIVDNLNTLLRTSFYTTAAREAGDFADFVRVSRFVFVLAEHHRGCFLHRN